MKTERNRDDGRPIGWLDGRTPTCRIKRIRKREGRCYELAMRGCMQALEWELVHGECNGHAGAGTIGHAWLEFDGEADAICLMLSSGNYGPWKDLSNSE